MAEALVSVLLEQLVSVAFEHTREAVTLVLTAKKDVEKFSRHLTTIQAKLEDAEQQQVMDASVRDWLDRLKDVSYEMDNLLDEWNTEILKQQVGKQLQEGEMNAVVTKKKENLNQPLKTSSFIDRSTIIGREEVTRNLLSKLSSESGQEGNGVLLIPIVGMGGIGKTTLAQSAYNHENVEKHFDKRIWVCVSDPFEELKIAKAIITSSGSKKNSDELQDILQCMSDSISGKKVLIVLDDVWTEDPENIAYLGREENEADGFGAIGEKIVRKCDGLPLATDVEEERVSLYDEQLTSSDLRF
ncbi:hypothetical protein ACLB2K_045854 [Fragaria x ananassa]